MDEATLRAAAKILTSRAGKLGARARNASLTAKERRDAASVASLARTPESREAGGRKGWASRTPEAIEKATRKRLRTLSERRRTHEKRRAGKDLRGARANSVK